MKAADLVGPALAVAGGIAAAAAIAISRADAAEPKKTLPDLPVWRVVICEPPAPYNGDCHHITQRRAIVRQDCERLADYVAGELHATQQLKPGTEIRCAVDPRALAHQRGL